MELSHKDIIGLYIIFTNIKNIDLDFNMAIFNKKLDDYVLKNLSVGQLKNVKDYYNSLEV